MNLPTWALRIASTICVSVALACGGSTVSQEGGVHDAGTGEANDGQCNVVGTPPPDGSTACNGFSPGDCAGTSCSPEGVECSYTPTSLSGVCCHGTWSCTGI
jgi:hypothetical protein